MTFRQLLEALQKHASDHPDAESLDQQVVVRVLDHNEDLHVGGLDSLSIDAGCCEVEALVLDADQAAQNAGSE